MRSDFPGWSKVHLFMTKHIYSVGSTVVNPKPVSESPAHETRGQRVIRKTSDLWSSWMGLKSNSLWGGKEAVGGQGAFVNLGTDETGCQPAPCPKALRFAQPEATSTTVDSRQNAAALEINLLDCSSYNVETDDQIN